ncbi:MAG: hypothetical protein RMJ67_09625 [Elusimicrobiota bacterium]|nr:hypothetical protein [Endomicrobiia bacterium]MDW8166754.1 hypothetical protein [Elusimicrobiota bacterium]
MGKIFMLLLIPVLIFTFILMPEISLSQSNHIYLNGKVISLSNNTIKIDSAKEPFYIVKDVKVLKHVKKGSSIYEEKALLKELQPGNSVTLKVTGNIVNEIIIEEYKK